MVPARVRPAARLRVPAARDGFLLETEQVAALVRELLGGAPDPDPTARPAG
ncbi:MULTISPECIES: hypothetical protein [unclassified Streptomyces]|uniref:hypothetical protein n=1 Tax=unclassified Streptomyces TaxID=2593676 RepID=UPI000AACA3EA|nr:MULTISPECIES: hypothetical protein [unclassified Streptomyces]